MINRICSLGSRGHLRYWTVLCNSSRKINVFRFGTYAPTNVKTDVGRDVVLYTNDNSQFHKVLTFFGLCQFGFWTYLSHFAFTTLRDVPVIPDSSLPWWRRINFGEKKYRYGISLGCLTIGCGVLLASYFYLLRSVVCLVLHRGGQRLTIVTAGPLGMERRTTVSLNKVSCQQSRHSSRVQLPIKVKGYSLYFTLDMRGQFSNASLFDHTAGLKRNL